MNTYSVIIVFLWLVPVLGLIVFPLLWSLFGRLYRAIERIRLAKINGCILENAGETAGTKKSENRNHPRIRLDGGHAYIDEESDCCKANILNISKDGICLEHVPETMNVKSNPNPNPLWILLRTGDKDYTFTAKPIWKKLTGNGYILGAEIDRTPSGWKNLLEGFNRSCAIKHA